MYEMNWPLRAGIGLGVAAILKLAQLRKLSQPVNNLVEDVADATKSKASTTKIGKLADEKIGKLVPDEKLKIKALADEAPVVAPSKPLSGSVVDSIPSVRDAEFNRWFNKLTPNELDEIWKNPKLRDAIEDRLRHPGGLHEWHLVARTPTFKRWGLTADQIKEMRSLIKDTEFVNPVGRHGGKGSTVAHNELLEIIDSSTNYEQFVRRLQNWANYRLKGGVDALPSGLRPQ